MAELGVLSGIAGLLSLGITVSKGILAYYNAFRGSQSDINHMCESLEAVCKTLVVISRLIARTQVNGAILDVVKSSVTSCHEGICALRKKLEKIKASEPPDEGKWKVALSNAKKKTLYPFRESTLIRMGEICNELRDNLGLAIDALHM